MLQLSLVVLRAASVTEVTDHSLQDVSRDTRYSILLAWPHARQANRQRREQSLVTQACDLSSPSAFESWGYTS